MTALLVIVLGAVVLGIVSAIAPLGPVTVLVLQRALLEDYRGARRIGLGRVPVESVYCGLATFGIVALLDEYPGVTLTIEIVGTLLFFAIGVWLLVQRPGRAAGPRAGAEDGGDGDGAPRRRSWGDWSGFIISLLNPTLILSWSAGVAIVVSMTGFEPTVTQKLVFPAALGLGIALGYLILIGLIRRWGARLEDAVVRRVIQAMGAVFVVLSLWNAAALAGFVG